MNSTPLCASEISPGLAPLPPPTIAAIDAVWWGSRNGRARDMPPSSRSPLSEWIIEVSSASAGVSGGRIPGKRAASMDLPDPGVPIINRWCRPAAAISSARLARSCPLTSRRSRPVGPSRTSPGSDGARQVWPVKCWITSRRLVAARTLTAPTHAASAPQAFGHISVLPSSAAAIAAGRAPITGTRDPSSDNSPNATQVSISSLGTISIAARSAIAIGRSKCDPSFGRSAGDRLIVIRLDGSAIDSVDSAERTRSRASLTALSGRPTMAKDGRPGVTAHCTSTIRASTPSNATV